MKKRMFYGAGPLIFAKARVLRLRTTEAERMLWSYLRQKPHGIKFRRQHPLGPFVVDFYAHRIKLVIEVDGHIHADPEIALKDKLRQEGIETDGITILRFTNDQVKNAFDQIKAQIEQTIRSQQTSTPNRG